MASCFPSPELLAFLTPQSSTTTPRRSVSLSQASIAWLQWCSSRAELRFRGSATNLTFRIGSLKDGSGGGGGVVAVEERGKESVNGRVSGVELNGNGNGNASGNGPARGVVTATTGTTGYGENGSVLNGGVNGGLVKYMNGNGAAAAEAEAVVVEVKEVKEEEERKKRVEEIGREQAWFKRSSDDQVEV